jgi:hypothetical protein
VTCCDARGNGVVVVAWDIGGTGLCEWPWMVLYDRVNALVCVCSCSSFSYFETSSEKWVNLLFLL